VSESRQSRRKRRGQATIEPEIPPIPDPPPRVEKEAFERVEKNLAAFAQRRFAKALPAVAAAFFSSSGGADRHNPELQAAFALYWVYGWRDDDGCRIVDMFAGFGLPQDDFSDAQALAALRNSRLILFELRSKEPANKQLVGEDILRGERITLLDHASFETLSAGDSLLAWCFPTGDLWRPMGVATLIPEATRKMVVDGLVGVAESEELTLMALPEKRPAKTFWMVYRVVNLGRTS
jgi:hypothetical protein